MSPEKLVYMANQIGKFFAHQGEAKAVASIADHLTRFWDPRMRHQIIGLFHDGAAGMDPSVKKAVAQIAASEPAPTN